jgi:hypothetical protein
LTPEFKLAGNASGTFSIRAVALLTPAEMDEAVKMKVDFRPPGHTGEPDHQIPAEGS